MPFIKGIPPGAISGKVVGLLLKEYMRNPAFARERKAIQRRYTGAIKAVAATILDWANESPSLTLAFLASDKSLPENLINCIENPSGLAPYPDARLSLLLELYHPHQKLIARSVPE